MRPDAPHDPAIEFVEERSDMGALVILAPPPQCWIQFLNQFLGLQRGTSPRQRPHPVPKASDRFLCGISDHPFRMQPAPNHARWKLSLPFGPHDSIPQKI